MEYGVHLPQITFEGQIWSLHRFVAYTETAEQLGFTAVCANDHLLFSRPWLDGPMLLAAVLAATRRMGVMTTVALPVVRGPVPLAKSLATLDVLSGGRLTVGVGAGSSAYDYAAVGIPFDERWKRLDEAVLALRALWNPDTHPFHGEFYATTGLTLQPAPAQPSGPPIWIGSWGSPSGLRRVARLADGWLASAYNTDPQAFAAAWARLRAYLGTTGKDATAFPNALVTMFLYVTEDRALADRLVRDILSPTLKRGADDLGQRLLIGGAHECAEKLASYQAVGVQQLFLWPVRDALRQLEIFSERVVPLVSGTGIHP